MQDKLIRYLLDSSGTNPDNLVRNEERILSKNKIRAIAPKYGAFFSDSVVVYDKINKRRLDYSTDFCTAGLLQNESMIYGKPINSVILILNGQVSNNVSVTYQCLGGDFERNNTGLESLLKSNRPTNDNTTFADIDKLPTTYKAAFHKHDFGDMYGMDYLVYLLERLRMAVVWKKIDMLTTVIDFINDYLNQLSTDVLILADDTFNSLLITFKAKFNKFIYELGLIKNYGTISLSEIKAIYDNEFFDKVVEAYLTLEGISSWKDELYSHAVSANLTNLGKSHGIYILPNLTSLANTMIGSVFLLNSYNINILDSLNLNEKIYPDLNRKDTVWSIKKMTGKVTDLGGVFMATALNYNISYIGKLTVNSMNELFIEWKALLSSLDLDFLNELEDHLKDKANPHKDHKSRLKLGNVENLPVATREEIVCNMPVRGYITFENLMLYMKRFQTGEKSVFDVDLVETETNTQRRMQAIFSPCGPCNTNKDEWSLVDECMVMEPPKRVPSAILEADRSLVTAEADFATLTSYMEDFTYNSEVTIKIYRRVVDYHEPTLPPPPVTEPPHVAKYYEVTWTGCRPDQDGLCPDAFMIQKIGDSKIVKPPAENTRTAVIVDDIGTIIRTGVTWEMSASEIRYRSGTAKQIIRNLTEIGGVYDVRGPVLNIQAGVLDDFAIRGMYKLTDEFTAERLLTFTGFLNGEKIGEIFFNQEYRVDVA